MIYPSEELYSLMAKKINKHDNLKKKNTRTFWPWLISLVFTKFGHCHLCFCNIHDFFLSKDIFFKEKMIHLESQTVAFWNIWNKKLKLGQKISGCWTGVEILSKKKFSRFCFPFPPYLSPTFPCPQLWPINYISTFNRKGRDSLVPTNLRNIDEGCFR